MKIQKITAIYILIVSFFTVQLHAQDGYTYTLIDNGGYSYTIGAVPNTSTNTFATSIQSYGFTIIIPDGVTASITSSLGNGASATFFNGSDVGDSSIDGYLITETLGSPISIAAPSSGTTTNMVTIQVNGAPTSGTMYILENNSSLAATVTPLKSFMSADMEDDGSAMYSNRVDPNGTGVSGSSSVDFSTLSVTQNEFLELTIYPNPVKDILYLTSVTPITKVEIINTNGQSVLNSTSNMEQLDVSRLQSGVYFLKIYHQKHSMTKKIVKL
ncbi:putative secreted protein (Por secretion system target) [Kordia periserrulae]|uniref:Putative secreted protein (Por secretion system target) n=1 Tax=Kordia periserrulae TaxID=701523 RepID=A0A2T6C5F2_9FLAO|nr:T9SS type A sorting domain-containing protein [Kordia periserrulae]PTX63517.1 putative secreted protein (Por secretion system target) [Kordia periserrulae]